MPYNQQIRIAIVDDHRLFRKGLIKLINAIGDKRFFILFEAEGGPEMIAKLDKKALPDVVLMDIDMKGMDGFETVLWLKNHFPDINVLVISMVESEEAIVRMLKLGVKGYLSKDIEPEDLAAALRAVAEKGYYYTDFITGKLINSIQSNVVETDREGRLLKPEIWHQLTEREREFIAHACTESTYDEIAGKMFVSPKTVDGYREAVFKKLGVKNRVGLVVFAVRHRLVVI